MLIKSMLKKSCNYIYAKKHNVMIKSGADVRISNEFEGKNYVGSNALVARSKIGFGTYICDDCYLDRVNIGKYCAIGTNVKLILAQHPIHTFVSIHPAFYSTREQAGFTYASKDLFEEFRLLDDKYAVLIGNDVWIGDDVKIMGGVTIGDGAVIGAGAIVTKDVMPYTIVAGVPAKMIGKRFEDNQIQQLLQYKWWNRDEEWIINNLKKFSDVEEFIKMNN